MHLGDESSSLALNPTPSLLVQICRFADLLVHNQIEVLARVFKRDQPFETECVGLKVLSLTY